MPPNLQVRFNYFLTHTNMHCNFFQYTVFGLFFIHILIPNIPQIVPYFNWWLNILVKTFFNQHSWASFACVFTKHTANSIKFAVNPLPHAWNVVKPAHAFKLADIGLNLTCGGLPIPLMHKYI